MSNFHIDNLLFVLSQFHVVTICDMSYENHRSAIAALCSTNLVLPV